MVGKATWGSTFRGLLVSLGVTLLLSAVLGIWFHFNPAAYYSLPTFVNVILLLSVFSGGFIAARQAENRVLIHGLILGIVFFALLLIITALRHQPLTMNLTLLRLFTLMAAATLGGAVARVFKK